MEAGKSESAVWVSRLKTQRADDANKVRWLSDGELPLAQGSRSLCSIQAFNWLDETHPKLGWQSALLNVCCLNVHLILKITFTETSTLAFEQYLGTVVQPSWCVKLAITGAMYLPALKMWVISFYIILIDRMWKAHVEITQCSGLPGVTGVDSEILWKYLCVFSSVDEASDRGKGGSLSWIYSRISPWCPPSIRIIPFLPITY